MTAWILDAARAADSPHAGGKARALARAQRAGLPVPEWFVVSASAFTDSLTRAQRDLLDHASDADVLQQTVDEVRLASGVERALTQAVRDLSATSDGLAVRSSASDEDGTRHSFAGQLESYLNVSPAHVADRVRAVWRSAFTPRILAYRREHGLPAAPRPPAVLVQRMVAPRAAGVAFSADPVSGRRGVAVVSAVRGLGSALVSGEADADTWRIDRDGAVVERRIVDQPVLTDEEARAVADLARAAARQFGRPQDIEWAWSDRLVLLQSRPITSLSAIADPDARLVIWDNSNIVESYSGVTTPLTFSFARESTSTSTSSSAE